MKNTAVFLLLSVLALNPGIAIAGEDHAHKGAEGNSSTAQAYSCPMHPEVTSDNPGECPKCGMKMEMKSKEMM